MPYVPQECQGLFDQVATLEQEYTTLATQVAGLVGGPAWTGLAQLGVKHRELDLVREDLAVCVKSHTAALTGNVVVMDASGTLPVGQQVATLWDFVGGVLAARETSAVQAGAFGFQAPLSAEAAITVATIGDPAVTGPDFRSGPFQVGASPAPRVEMVIAPPITLTQADLDTWASGFQSTTQPVYETLSATVSAVKGTLGAGAVTVGVNGTLAGALGNASLPQTTFSASVSFALFPSSDPSASEIVRVALAGTNPIRLELSGSLLGELVDQLSSLVAPMLGELVRKALDDWAHQTIPAAAAEMLTLLQLPAGTTITLRSITINEAGISFQPALGTIGTTLSTFQPPSIPPP
jgi:hypothetical protein